MQTKPMSDVFLEQLKAGLQTCQMKGGGIVAVSGGADSVALLSGLCRLRQACSLDVRVAHLNHLLRGAESDQDAVFVEELCRSLGVPCDIERVDVSKSSAGGIGIEEAARNCRLDFLKRTAERHGATWVATAHHLDDQAETILHHLVRGTGLAGLRGIPQRRELAPGVFLVRPLLKISRQTILSALEEWNQAFREDSSNSSEEFTRNRIRHQLLPLLREEFNPRVTDALGRLSSQAAEWEEFLSASATKFLATTLLEKSPAGYRLRRSLWLEQPPLLQQEALRQLWEGLDWPRQNMSAAHWERLLRTIRDSGKQDFPGEVKLEVRDDLIRLSQE